MELGGFLRHGVTSRSCVGRKGREKKGLGCQARRLRLRRRLAPGSRVSGRLREGRWGDAWLRGCVAGLKQRLFARSGWGDRVEMFRAGQGLETLR